MRNGKSDFLKCCRSVEEGTEIHLKNAVSKEIGLLRYCDDRFHVEVEGKEDSWLPQVCEVTTDV